MFYFKHYLEDNQQVSAPSPLFTGTCESNLLKERPQKSQISCYFMADTLQLFLVIHYELLEGTHFVSQKSNPIPAKQWVLNKYLNYQW